MNHWPKEWMDEWMKVCTHVYNRQIAICRFHSLMACGRTLFCQKSLNALKTALNDKCHDACPQVSRDKVCFQADAVIQCSDSMQWLIYWAKFESALIKNWQDCAVVLQVSLRCRTGARESAAVLVLDCVPRLVRRQCPCAWDGLTPNPGQEAGDSLDAYLQRPNCI